MPKITFENGYSVNFDGDPTDDDIEEAYQHTTKLPPKQKQDDGGVFKGIGESALALGSSMALAPIGGLAALGSLATGQGLDKSIKNLEGVMEQGYQPRSEKGKKYTENASWALNLPAEYGGKAGEFIAGNEGRLVGEVAGNFATDLLPFGLAAKGMKKFGKKTEVTALDKIRAETKPVEKPPEPLKDTRDPKMLSKQAYEQALRERELQRTSAFNRPEQFPDLIQEDPMTRMARDLGADVDRPTPKPEPTTPMEKMAADLERGPNNTEAWKAQDILEGRKAEEDFQVKRQTALDSQAAELQRLEGRPAVSPEQKVLEATRNQEELRSYMEQVKTQLEETKLQEAAAKARGDLEAAKRAEVAQKALEDRQTQLELEVKQQATLDLNAAERGRQEAAPLPVDTPPTKHDFWTNFKKGPISSKSSMGRQRGAILNPFAKNEPLDPMRASKDGTLVPENPNIKAVIEKAKGEKDGKLLTYFQSGATNAAHKTGSTLIKAASQIVQNATKRAEKVVRGAVHPAEEALRKLSKDEVHTLGELFKDEMFKGQRYDGEVLAKHLSIKQIQAYVKVREMFDASLDIQNTARDAKGLKPITAQEAYMSSRWSGDFRRPVYDKNKKLVWYLAANSKLGLESQSKALLKKFPDLVIDPKKDHTIRSEIGKTDLQSMYTTMLDILGRDDPAVQKIEAAIKDQVVNEGESFRGQTKHHENKANIRGFVGDRPGVNPVKDSIDMFQQQTQYAKNAIQWSEMQKAADDIKGILADPELNQSQPNNVKYVREYFKNAIGHGEAKAVRAISDTIREGLGVSPKVLSDGVGSVKSFFIMQKLGFSAGYTLSNMIQTTNVIPHMTALMSEGYRGNPLNALSIGAITGPAMAATHMLHKSGGEFKFPNQFVRDAFKYAEDNGVIARSIVDESPVRDSFGVMAPVKRAVSWTLSTPEAFVRSTAFMTYAQFLKDSGKFKDPKALFQKAEEMVNNSMVDYRETERPLMFSKLGAAGNALNTLQTFPMSFYNQHLEMAKYLKKGNPIPLAAMLGMDYMMAGALGIPYLNDIEKLFGYIRDNVVSHSTYKKMIDSPMLSDPKAWLMENMGRASVYGELSERTGLGLSSRVSAPNPSEMIQAPTGPILDLAKQAGNIGSAALDPTNTTKWAQVAMGSVPSGLAGLLENTGIMKDHTYVERPDGTRLTMKSSDLEAREGKYARTPEEVKMRQFGIRSQKEVVTNDLNYANNKAKTTMKDRSGDIVDKYYDAARRGNKKKASELYDLYRELTGKDMPEMDTRSKGEFMTDLEKNIDKNQNSARMLLNAARTQQILQGK